MKFLNFNKVLCLSPHPDDVEYSMLGSIIKYRNTQFDVFCMTKGGAKGFDKTNGPMRLVEVNNVWCKANLDNANIMISDCDFFEDKDRDAGWVNYIENTFIKNGNYDCIFIPTKDDSMFEHRFVNGLGPALVRISPISLVEYQTPSTLNSWQPNIFIDVKNQYKKKISYLQEFKSQISKSYFKKDTLDSFHSNFQCSKRGIKKIEQFKMMELFDIR
jgi:N-acetylglucosamine malate deacetylase 1|tara:strand:- start:7707 stop:8354 length:648 start_codon:yes stop_codon:yes gene_type:complete